jgi:hypothetical protein
MDHPGNKEVGDEAAATPRILEKVAGRVTGETDI